MLKTTLTAHDRKHMIDQIRNLPALVRDSVKGLNDEQLNTPYGPGKWTVLQVVHHLADSHMNAFVRMKLVLTEDHPTIKVYGQDDWARTREASQYPIQASLSIISGLHERWSNLLDSLPEPAWKRTAYHPEHGDMILEDFLKIYAGHGENHVGQITRLRKDRGW
ncbi:MAG: putative metal-dependent hydrolase [Candidatus Zixiibacteriota bacterium]